MKDRSGKWFKSVISLIMVVVILIGMIPSSVQAATTSTAARIYSDFTTSPAYKNYSEFASLYVSKYSKPIPGLAHTDVNGTDCTNMVPQGICFAKDYLIISAYDANGSCNSVLYVIATADRSYLMTVVLPTKAHVGGVAFDGTYLWVSNGKNASSIKYSTLQSTVDSAVAAGKKSVSISFHTTCATATTASFMTYHDGMLWVGLFTDKGDSSGMMYSYTIGSGASKLTKKYNITLPDRIQGACFKDGYLILSRSYSRNVSSSSHISQLRIYKYSAPDSSGNIKKNSVVKVIDLPPMVEGIVAGSTYMYLLFESGATKYYKGTDGSGTCKYPTDRYVAFKFGDFLELSGSSTTAPGEAGYFPACDPNESSIANALSSLGYDSSYANRKVIAAANGITNYTGTAEQNIQLLDLMKTGKLIDPNGGSSGGSTGGGSTGGGTTDEGDTPGEDSTEEEPIVPVTVELEFYSTMLLAGESAQIRASFTEGSVSWTSSDTSVATVSAVGADTASIKALRSGTAVITCSLSNGVSAKCVVTVETTCFKACAADQTSFADALSSQNFDASLATRARIAEVNGISGYSGAQEEDQALLLLMKEGKLINPGLVPVANEPVPVLLSQTIAKLYVGQRLQLAASFSDGAVYWKTSDVRVITVKALDSDTVMLNAVGEGNATITCVHDDGSFAKCRVQVECLYFPAYTGGRDSVTDALDELNYDITADDLAFIAHVNGVTDYQGTAAQDGEIMAILREGKLIDPGLPTRAQTGLYFEMCDPSYESIAPALESIGVDNSKTNREQIAAANGITDYTGTAAQNDQMLALLKAGKLRKPDLILKEGEYRVSFNANGGTGEMKAVGLANGATIPGNTFTLKGHAFAGWATSASGAVVYANGGTITISGDMELYAVWTPNHYTLRYDANGGQGTMADTVVTYGTSTKLRTPAFTREGYTLSGWYRYRSSDNKWLYSSSDGQTTGWYVDGTQPSGYKKVVLKTTSSVSKTSAIDGDVVILYAVWVKGSGGASLDGKTVVFIGNSFVYYGGAVEHGGQKKTDKGWFYEICKANGENVTVIDCTYGSHHLYDFTSKGCKSGSCHNGKDLLSGLDFKSVDYVFISESGNNNSNFLKDVKAVMKRFTNSKTKFFYLSHSYTYSKNHTKIINNLDDLEKLGVGIIEWGKLVDDVIDGRASVSGGTQKYKKNTFIKNKGDTYHPNPLAGYITAQMAYCAVTGKSAVGQMPDVYNVGNTLKYGKSAVGYSAYISKHYKSSTSSNFKAVLKSEADMAGLQKLMNKYLKKWGLGIDG